MLSNKFFGSFYPVNSSIHKINPVIKFICLFLFLIPIIGSENIRLHVVMFFLIVFMMYLSRVPMRFYFDMLYGLRYIFIIIIFMLASKGLELESALVILLKLFCVIENLALIFYTTSPSELKYGIEKCLTPFNIFNFKLGRLSNLLVSIITFFPMMFTTEQSVLKSASARGLDYFHGDVLSRIYASLSSLKNTLRLTIEKIRLVKFNSELKMYDVKKYRTNLRVKKVGFSDLILLGIHIVFVFSYVTEVGII